MFEVFVKQRYRIEIGRDGFVKYVSEINFATIRIRYDMIRETDW